MISIKISHLLKRFGSMIALDRINLDIHPGELFFLLGPSGCGKTTLLRCVAGFYKPEEGRIHLGDNDVTRLDPYKRNTGMVFQSYALWPHMTVSENVAFGLKQKKVPVTEMRPRIMQALESVRMLQYKDRKPNELSGGQQQRVALARALVIRPKCLLLDEPLSNLDARLRNEMRLEIRRICKEYKLTALYVTHDQKEALSIADRIAVMEGGQVEQIGTPEGIYKRPISRFVADFIGESNFLKGEISKIVDGQAVVTTAVGVFRGVISSPIYKLSEGSKVYVLVRPECWRFENNLLSENCVKGDIGSATYYGEVAHYDFVADQKVHFKVSELNPRHLSRSDQTRLYCCADVEDVVILPQ
jgi:iron(III) transport system ATP-binding protein